MATVVAGIFTYHDWQLNPGGIFYSNQETHWKYVWETFISWWWPVALIVTALSWGVLLILGKLRN